MSSIPFGHVGPGPQGASPSKDRISVHVDLRQMLARLWRHLKPAPDDRALIDSMNGETLSELGIERVTQLRGSTWGASPMVERHYRWLCDETGRGDGRYLF